MFYKKVLFSFPRFLSVLLSFSEQFLKNESTPVIYLFSTNLFC